MTNYHACSVIQMCAVWYACMQLVWVACDCCVHVSFAMKIGVHVGINTIHAVSVVYRLWLDYSDVLDKIFGYAIT